MSRRRTLISHLSLATLRALALRHDIAVADARVRAQLVDAVVAHGALKLRALLDEVTRDDLQGLCRALDLDDRGRSKSELIERLLERTGTSDATQGKESAAMLLTALLAEALEVLDGSPAAKTRFTHDRQWLDERRAQWALSCWRIGLIGVTSAGKSTLLNALLRSDLLPTAVRPSSNGLVVCRHGQALEVTVHYKQRAPERVTLDHKHRLEQLGDESLNPGNRAGVKEIHLRTPHFRLGEGVAMIDSPGLDAYDLEEHEAVTLKLLLPTLDIVVFLTTVKANSDRQMADYVETVRAAGKPVVIVQNMIDTIEPKLGAWGAIIKDRATIAKEHRDRVEKVLRGAGYPQAEHVPIIQVSARSALKPATYTQSNLDGVIASVRDYVAKIAPGLENGRRRQLIDHLRRVVDQESATDAENEKIAQKETALLSQKEHEVANAANELAQALIALAKELDERRKDLVRSAGQLGAGDHEPAASLVRAAKAWATSVAKRVHSLLDAFMSASRTIARGLNMTTRDYALSPLDSPKTPESLAVRTTSELLPRQREVAGVFAAIKRFFGAGGYETYYESRQRVDVPQLTEALREHGASVSAWFKLNAAALGETSATWTTTFKAEIRGRRKAIRDRMAGIITTEERAQIREKLGDILTRLDGGIHPEWTPATKEAHANSTEIAGDNSIINIPRYGLSALRFAQGMAEQRFIITRQHYLRRVKQAARGRVTIWGWDRDALERFSARFFPEFRDIHLTDPVATRYGNEDVKQLLVIDETRTSPSRAKLEAALLTSKATSLFVVMDPGAMTGAAIGSPVHGPLNEVAGRFVVIQSLAGVWESEHFVPTLVQLQGILSSADVRQDSVHGFLANDDDIRRSVLIDALLNTSASTPTVKEEMAWIRALGFGEDEPVSTSNFVGKVLREWHARNATPSQ